MSWNWLELNVKKNDWVHFQTSYSFFFQVDIEFHLLDLGNSDKLFCIFSILIVIQILTMTLCVLPVKVCFPGVIWSFD